MISALSPRRSQPQFALSAARSRLSQGLVLLHNGASPRSDIIAGPATTVSGSPVARATSRGWSSDFAGSQDYRWSRALTGTDPAEATLFGLVSADSVAAEMTIVGQSYSFTSGALFRIELNGSSQFRAQFRDSASVGLANISSSVTVVANRMYFVVGVFRAGSGLKELWVDGAQHGTSTTSIGTMTLNQTEVGVLVRDSALQWWDGVIPLAGIYNRALSSTEIIELSRNPWQLFAPSNDRRYWAVLGGGSAFQSSFSAKSGLRSSGSIVAGRNSALAARAGAQGSGTSSKFVALGISAIAGAVGSASGKKAATAGISAISGLLAALETTTPGTSDFNAITGALVSVTHSTARLGTIQARVGARGNVTGLRRAVTSLQAIAGAVAAIEGSPDDNRTSTFAAIAGAAAALSKTTARIASLAAKVGLLGQDTAATIRAAQLAAIAGLKAAIAGINVETAGRLLTVSVSAQAAYECVVAARAAYHCTVSEAIVQ